jgi:hypothetical protein
VEIIDMTTQCVREPAAESKVVTRLQQRKFWFAVCSDMFGHEVVGAHIKSPKPVDPKRQSWQPFVAWQWLIKEAARRERQRVIKGRQIPLQRGQLAVSERYFGHEANWGRKAVRVFFERLQRFRMITIGGSEAGRDQDGTRTKKGPALTVVTICNYDAYQSAPDRQGPQRAQEGPSRGPAGAQDSTERQGRQREKEDPPPPPKKEEKEKSAVVGFLLDEEEDRQPLRRAIPQTIIRQLEEQVGAERAQELASTYLASDFARDAKFIDKAFSGWLRTYGITIKPNGAASAGNLAAEILAMLPRNADGTPNLALPKVVSRRTA